MVEKVSVLLESSGGLLWSVFHVSSVCKCAHNLNAEMKS